MEDAKHIIGRLAPSPTGYLHLGNAWSFLLAWLSVRLQGGTLYLRMEDIDPARSKPEYTDGILEDFAWLGIDFDGGIIYQSKRSDIYEEYINRLSAFIYPCYCTRKELREMAGAPQSATPKIMTPANRLIMPDTGAIYRRSCRFLTEEQRAQKQNQNACLRLACPPFDEREQEKIPAEIFNLSPDFFFDDLVLGRQHINLNDCGGDFALRRSDKVWAYQLAVSIDDMLTGVNEVVRGNDILTSTPRQLYLFRLLGKTAPAYAHIPLLLDNAGERLAKRHASLSLKALRGKYKSPAPVLQYLAEFINIREDISSAKELLTILQNSGHSSFPWHVLTKLGSAVRTDFQ